MRLMRSGWALVCVAILGGGAAGPAKTKRLWPQAPKDTEGGHYIAPGPGAHVPFNSSTYRSVYDLFHAFEARRVPAALFFGNSCPSSRPVRRRRLLTSSRPVRRRRLLTYPHSILGSHIGAERHAGIIPFNEKDVDIAVFTQNETLVESILTEVVGAALWGNQTDGRGKGTAGFGYHAKVIRPPRPRHRRRRLRSRGRHAPIP